MALALRRYGTFVHALFFVLGFTTIFVALGASASALGQVLGENLLWLQRMGGLLVIVFGLHSTGLITIPFLYTERRVHMNANPHLGYLSSYLIGLSFAAGWTPCVGPVLGTALTYAASTAQVGQGVTLLTVYSLGLGIPFLLTGLFFQAATGVLRKMRRILPVISLISGIFLIFLGILLLTDGLSRLSSLIFEGLRLFGIQNAASFTLESTLGEVEAPTLPIAFIAGLLSFVSPCVLPLVPSFIGYMSGTTVSNLAVTTPVPASQPISPVASVVSE